MLEIAEPNDAREPMGGAAVVAGLIALDPQHTLASARQVLKRRATLAPRPQTTTSKWLMCRACREALVSLRTGYAEENAICERWASGGADWPL